jgi:hypothetical protein
MDELNEVIAILRDEGKSVEWNISLEGKVSLLVDGRMVDYEIERDRVLGKASSHEDVSHNGKDYRIIWEPRDTSHPANSLVAVFELPESKMVWKEPGIDYRPGHMMAIAREFIRKLR